MTDPALLPILQKLVPQKDGEPYVVHRTALVDAVNSDGTVDVELSGVVVPNVPVLERALVLAGDVVQVLAWQGALLVLGRVETTSRPANPVVRAYTSNNTWSKPDGLLHVRVRVWGGGGGGAGAAATGSGQQSGGGGGGGGGYREGIIPAGSLASSVAVTVGAGGSGSSTTTGGAGGTSSFGSHISVGGGNGGTHQGVIATATTPSGGAGGGGGSGGQLLVWGSGGFRSLLFGPAIPYLTMTGAGGSAGGPGGGTSGQALQNGNGNAGVFPGGGGSGATNAQSQGAARTGGAGATGCVIVEEFYA